jgi:hypothetical protein
MPSIGYEFLTTLQEDFTKYTNFVETGTYFGESIFAMEPFFPKLHTIEIKKEFYENARLRYRGNKIQFYLGDSSVVLNEMVPLLEGRSIFFLDGHWSAGNTGKGNKDCPLYEELQSIVTHHKEDAIIIVDDVRLFGKGPTYGNEICNWEDINTDMIVRIVKDRMNRMYFLPSSICANDRLIIHLSKMRMGSFGKCISL